MPIMASSRPSAACLATATFRFRHSRVGLSADHAHLSGVTMRSTPRHLTRILALVALAFMVACGGGGEQSASTDSLSRSASENVSSPCAPDLCVAFNYPQADLARLLSAEITPFSAKALAGYKAHYELTSGSLPSGLTLDAGTGQILGTPTEVGSHVANLRLTVDGYRGSLSTEVRISVAEPQLVFSTARHTVGTLNVPLNTFVEGVPGNARLSLAGKGPLQSINVRLGSANQPRFRVSGPVLLPPGLSLDAGTGVIGGTPTQAGAWFVPIDVTVDSAGGPRTYSTVAGISVYKVIQAQAGQTAPEVRMSVFAPPSMSVAGNVSQSGGAVGYRMAYDPGSATVVVTSPLISPTAVAGTYSGGYTMLLSLSSGTKAEAGYVVVLGGVTVIK